MKSIRPKKSGVWRYYEVDLEDDSRAVCKMCPGLTISRGSKTKGPQSYGTSALWAHLKLSHKTEYASLEKCPSYPAKMQKRGTAKAPRQPSGGARSATRDLAVPNTSSQARTKAAAEAGGADEGPLFLLGEMIALDNHSVSIVQEAGFQRLLGALLPSFDIGGCRPQVLGEGVLPQIYSRARRRVEAMLEEAEWLCLSLDVDQTSLEGETLLVVTARWVDQAYQLVDVILGANLFPTYPSHKILDSLFEETLDAWRLGKAKVHLVVHEYAEKAVRAVPVVCEVPNEAFFANLLQMTVEDSLLPQNAVSRVLDLCRNFICYSNEARDTLDIMNLLHNVPITRRSAESELVLDSSGDWRSTYAMLTNMKKHRDSIDNLTSLNQALKITAADWAVVEDVIQAFRPLGEVTQKADSSINFISCFIPSAAVLLQYFNKMMPRGCSEVHQTLREGLERTFHHEYRVEERRSLVLATVLDPRYKLAFVSENNRPMARTWLLEEVQAQATFSDQVETVDSGSSFVDIWECYAEIATGRTSVEAITPTGRTSVGATTGDSPKVSTEVKELDLYLNSSLAPRHQNPLLWWKESQSFYPRLSRLARRYLSAPLDSCFAKHRNPRLLARLRRQTEEDLALSSHCLDFSQRLFLHLNLPSTKFTY